MASYAGGAGGGLDESLEMRLEGSAAEKRVVGELAELYSILQACDKLETAYIRDMVPPEAYTPACNNLIGKFKIQLEALKSMRAVDSIDTFLRDYNISLPQVYTRLVVDGVPATALHKSADSRLESLAVAECVSCMITSLDVLRLGQRAVDEIMPNLTPVCESLSKAPMVKGDHPLKVKLDAWLRELQGKPASYELSPDEARQLLFDLDSMYAAFTAQLKTQGVGGGAGGGAGGGR